MSGELQYTAGEGLYDCANDCGAKVAIDGALCDDCAETHVICIDCGAVVTLDYAWAFADELYCRECFDDRFTTCVECGDVIHRIYARSNADGDTYCECCFADQYTTCDRCGETVRRDNAHYLEWSDCTLCDDCREDDDDSSIDDYHSNDKTAQFFGIAPWHIGIELEIDAVEYPNHTESAEFIHSLFDRQEVYLEHDSSLENGFEIITAPHGFREMRNLRPTFDELCAGLRKRGYHSHDTRTCGLHVHISVTALGETESERDLTTAKLLYLSERFENELIALSRRDNATTHRTNDLHYCTPRKGADTIKNAEKMVKDCKYYGERHRPWNLTNATTIEYRLSRGTLNSETLFACIMLPVYLIDGAREISVLDAQNIGSVHEWINAATLPAEPTLTDYVNSKVGA